IDEAIKMGTRCAPSDDSSHITKFDSPEAILVTPASDYVSDFIGKGASLKRLSLSRVRDIDLSPWPTVLEDAGRDDVLEALRDSGKRTVLVLDRQRRPLRWGGAEHVERDDRRSLREIGLPARAFVESHSTLSDTLNELVVARYSLPIVTDADAVFQVIVDIDIINDAIRTIRHS